MSPGSPADIADRPAGIGIDALELFVEVLSQSEPGSTTDGFYDRLCEAVCRMAQMRRALIFRYDSGDRRVRAVGAHGMESAQFAGAHLTVDRRRSPPRHCARTR